MSFLLWYANNIMLVQKTGCYMQIDLWKLFLTAHDAGSDFKFYANKLTMLTKIAANVYYSLLLP